MGDVQKDIGNHDWEFRKKTSWYIWILQSYICIILHVGTFVHWYICSPHALLRIV